MEVMEYHYDCYKTPGKTSASTAVRRLALWAERYQKAYALFTFITRSARLNKQRSGDFRLFPPANFANSAILPTAKISTLLCKISLLRKSKDSSWSMPSTPQGRMIDREQAVPRLSHSADRPKHNIIGPKLCNKSRATL